MVQEDELDVVRSSCASVLAKNLDLGMRLLNFNHCCQLIKVIYNVLIYKYCKYCECFSGKEILLIPCIIYLESRISTCAC